MIGIDLVSVPEFQRQLDLGGERFLEKVFLPAELDDRRIEHLAGLFAAKEAVWKAGGDPSLELRSIVLAKVPSGKPVVTTPRGRFEVSISHDGDHAIAIAMRIEP